MQTLKKLPKVLMTLAAFGHGPMDLGADPVRRLEHACGITALNLLLITLAVTPVREITGLAHLLRLRRMLGLFAFFYALAHFSIYFTLDQWFDEAQFESYRMLGAHSAAAPRPPPRRRSPDSSTPISRVSG